MSNGDSSIEKASSLKGAVQSIDLKEGGERERKCRRVKATAAAESLNQCI